jgi:hypothetical protein
MTCASMFSRLLFVILLAAAGWLTPTPTVAQEPAPVGFVAEIQGAWEFVESGVAVQLGQALPPVASLRATPPISPEARLVVALFDGQTLIRSCRVAGACSIPVLLPELLGSGNEERFLRVLKRLFLGIEHPPAHTLVRGFPLGLREAVIRIDGRSLFLSEVFTGIATEDPSVKLLLLDDAGDVATTVQPIRVHARLDGESVTLPEPISEGLYEISLIREPPAGEVTSGEVAWVLILATPRFSARRDEFARASRVGDAWSSEIDPSVVRQIMRQILRDVAVNPGLGGK